MADFSQLATGWQIGASPEKMDLNRESSEAELEMG
jgi:hypothetical protein